MSRFLTPPIPKPEQSGHEADKRYHKLRLQVFIGAFIGYAAFYLVRKNFTMAIPMLKSFGFDKGELGTVLAMNAIAYALSKFLMGSVSDRSDARKFLPLGLVLASISMMFMIVPITIFGPNHHYLAIILMGVLNFLVGWFNGMGWPPCGRIMTHWFSQNERGTKMSIWNCAHNVGGSLVGPMSVYGAIWFGSWFYGAHTQYYFLIGTFVFPAVTSILIAIIAYCLLRDTPQSCGLSSIEKWRNDYPKNYSEKSEKVLTAKEIFLKNVLNNKFLWYIACANAFVYMVRYGCLDWAPTILTEKGIDLKETGWAYFAYEYAGIPGTLLCGWISDKVFKGRRAPAIVIYMLLVMIAIYVYWQNPPGHILIDNIALIAIGFLIYGPVMLIGVQALDLVPKKAAGTAAGLTGLFGYLGGALGANIAIGFIVDHMGWDAAFILMLAACVMAIFFTMFTWNAEKRRLKAD